MNQQAAAFPLVHQVEFLSSKKQYGSTKLTMLFANAIQRIINTAGSPKRNHMHQFFNRGISHG